MTAGVQLRRALPVAVALALVGVLAGQLLISLKPAAQADRSTPCRRLQPENENPVLGLLPRPSPDFEAMDYRGQRVPLSAFRGKVVFLNFWSTTCDPCIREMPGMEQLQNRVGKDDFVVLALASHQSFLPVRRFFPDGTSMTPLLDPPPREGAAGAIADQFGIDGWPETYLIDKNGNLRYYFVNARDWSSQTAYQCVRSLIDED